MKVALDVLGQEKAPSVNELTTAIGAAVECELRPQLVQGTGPDLYRQVTKRFHSSTGTQQKSTVYRLRFNQAGLEWDTWPRITRKTRLALGALTAWPPPQSWIEKAIQEYTQTRQDRDALLPGIPRAYVTRSWSNRSAWPTACGRCSALATTGPTTSEEAI